MEAEEIHKRIRTEKRLAEDNEIRRVMAQLADRIRDVEELAQNHEFPIELESLPNTSRFNVRHMQKASRIIQSIRFPETCFNFPKFATKEEKESTYELLIGTLKYAEFLDQSLKLCGYYYKYCKRDHYDDVMVIAYDLLDRNFQIGEDKLTHPKKYAEIQQSLLKVHVKVMAHFARLKIRASATSLNGLLPEQIQHQGPRAEQDPIYGWLNLTKISMEEVSVHLKNEGLVQTFLDDHSLMRPDSFFVNPSHSNLFRFHSSQLGLLLNGKLKDYFVVQDKSACLPVYTLVKALYFKAPLKALPTGVAQVEERRQITPTSFSQSLTPKTDWYDNILDSTDSNNEAIGDSLIVTHCGSGRSVAHLATLLQTSVPRYITRQNNVMTSEHDLIKTLGTKFVRRVPLRIVAFGAPVHKVEEIRYYVRKKLGVKDVKIYTQDFREVDANDKRVTGAVGIFVNPPSTGSALKDPVSYICTEGGDEEVLSELSRFMKNHAHKMFQAFDSSTSFQGCQGKYIRHALTFPQAKLILYTTCSVLKEETSDALLSAFSNAQARAQERKMASLADLILKPNSRYLRDTGFELVDISTILEGYPRDAFNGTCLRMGCTSTSSGCFIGLIRRKESTFSVKKSVVKLEDTWNRNELDSGRVEEVIKDTKGKFSQNTLSKFFRDQVTGNLLTRILDSGNQPRPGEEVVFSISSSVETYYDNEPSSSKKSKSMVDQRGRVFDRLAMQKTCSSAAKQTGKWRPGTSHSGNVTTSSTYPRPRTVVSKAGNDNN